MAMTDAQNNIEMFIGFWNLPKQLSNILLKTVDDCQLFYISFFGKNRYVIDDLLDFRDYKIENSNTDIDKFLDMCYNGNVTVAFEETFLQSFTSDDISIINDAIVKSKTTFKNIYNAFKKNPNQNILKNVL